MPSNIKQYKGPVKKSAALMNQSPLSGLPLQREENRSVICGSNAYQDFGSPFGISFDMKAEKTEFNDFSTQPASLIKKKIIADAES